MVLLLQEEEEQEEQEEQGREGVKAAVHSGGDSTGRPSSSLRKGDDKRSSVRAHRS